MKNRHAKHDYFFDNLCMRAISSRSTFLHGFLLLHQEAFDDLCISRVVAFPLSRPLLFGLCNFTKWARFLAHF